MPACSTTRAFVVHRRAIQANGGADTVFGIQVHRVAGLLGEPMDHRQAQPGAVADILGGEERIHHRIDHALRKTAAIVGNRNRYIRTRHEIGIANAVLRVDHHLTGAHRNADIDAAADRVARVQQNVQQRDLQLCGIDPAADYSSHAQCRQ
jgi:hypothetical protein